MRILYKQTQFYSLDRLGLFDQDLRDIEDILAAPNGLIFVADLPAAVKPLVIRMSASLNSVHAPDVIGTP